MAVVPAVPSRSDHLLSAGHELLREQHVDRLLRAEADV
jgi:hypothetical protein